ncbi:MAG: 16S rRNA (cytosine(967)-C(5))-methyltransferase RsmB [Bacteroidota bacterium]|nr:16S rRNA (cytosine(967)-C(5))-methyltransferase RsmB [Bacteroidota bacterium]
MTLTDQQNIYEGVRGTSIKILNRIERTDAYLDKLLDAELRSKDLSDLDKSLLNEIVHGVIRWRSRLDWVINGFYHGNYVKSEINLKNAMRVATYQILFLQKIPHHAAVNEAVEFIKRLNGEKAANLVNAVLRTIIRNIDEIKFPDPATDTVHYLGVYYAHPTWMVKKWLARFGFEETQKLLLANNQIPEITIRINRLKIEPAKFLSSLEESKLSYQGSEYIDYYLRVRNLSELSELNYFQSGYFTIQDESAALPSILLNPQPCERVIDMCAAPGGKTTHLAELMKNSGKIIAIDKYDHKLNLIRTSCDRLGIDIVDYVVGDASELELESADKILVDVPCSGLGVLRKKPDIKWKREPDDLLKLNVFQTGLLNNAAKLLKPGGAIVYSTCTTEPEENFNLIQDFLKKHTDFYIDNASKYVNQALVNSNGCVETFTYKHHMDGSFAVRLVKSSQLSDK